MSEIAENVSLEMSNVISYRGKVTQLQLQEISRDMERIITSNNAKKNGSGVSATFGIDTSSGQPILDIELLIPLDKEITVPDEYTFKPIFRLRNAVKIRHYGSPASLQNSANEIMKYISEHKLTAVTAGYNVTVKEPTSPTDIESMIVDIYVGVNDNIL